MQYNGKPMITSLKQLKCTHCKSEEVVVERITDDTSEVTDNKTVWFECLDCGLHGYVYYTKREIRC